MATLVTLLWSAADAAIISDMALSLRHYNVAASHDSEEILPR